MYLHQWIPPLFIMLHFNLAFKESFPKINMHYPSHIKTLYFIQEKSKLEKATLFQSLWFTTFART